MRIVSCTICGSEFEATSPHHSLCSEGCKLESKRASYRKASKKWRKKPDSLSIQVKQNKVWRAANPYKYRISSIKSRCNRLGIAFDLDDQWLADNTPEFCPILGIKLDTGEANARASVDRLVPEKGYVKSNCRVISMKANTLKNDATKEDLIRLLAYLEENT